MVYKSSSLEDTANIAKTVADSLCGGECIAFTGGMGMGKTAFTKALAKALGYDIFCYTGYTFEKLCSEFENHPEYKELLSYCDWLVDGPFVLEKRSLMTKFRGSTNQRILDVKKSLECNKAIETEV